MQSKKQTRSIYFSRTLSVMVDFMNSAIVHVGLHNESIEASKQEQLMNHKMSP